jgi:2-methylisocitrate lyase-like PEP mutase family enzyme
MSPGRPDTRSRDRTLLELRASPEVLVLADVWDVVSARVGAGTPGVRALATASRSIAATSGYADGGQIPLALHLDMVELIVDAAGAVGGDLEDQLQPLDEAVGPVEAVLGAGPTWRTAPRWCSCPG